MYQLVLQFVGNSLNDLDTLIALEDSLTNELGNLADVDGHDIGAGECNIFIHTENPSGTFLNIKSLLQTTGSLNKVRVAYRSFTDEKYIVIWPERSTDEFSIK